MSDAINPDHYKRLPAEAIEIIESAIQNAPSNRDAYLHGQVFKYVLRCWNKNGIEDLKKAKWYLDRLVNSLDESEQQKAADLQSLKDHPFGKLKQPAWTPQVGDWVRIRKPADTQASACIWVESMNKYDGQIIEVKQLSEEGILHDNWGFMFEWLEPAEQPAIKKSLTTEPPDGWRWIEVGETLRRGDTTNTIDEIPEVCIGTKCVVKHFALRRNRFEVGEKVVENIKQRIGVVKEKIGCAESPFEYRVEMIDTKGDRYFFPHHLAPYIEEAT